MGLKERMSGQWRDCGSCGEDAHTNPKVLDSHDFIPAVGPGTNAGMVRVSVREHVVLQISLDYDSHGLSLPALLTEPDGR